MTVTTTKFVGTISVA